MSSRSRTPSVSETLEKVGQPDGRLASQGKKRTRTGCLGCRKRRRKCDEVKPACEGCRTRNETCQWGVKVSFREENAQTIDSEHPSMRIGLSSSKPQAYQIVDVTSEIAREYVEDASQIQLDERTNGKSMVLDIIDDRDAHRASATSIRLPTDTPSHGQPHSISLQQSQPDLAEPSFSFEPYAGLNTAELAFTSPHISESSFEDGIFLPGTEYEELYSTFRSRIIDTAKSVAPSLQASPISSPHPVSELDLEVLGDTQSFPEMSAEDEYMLWQNYIYEVAPWIDKFDNKRHFESVLPILAKSNLHLKYAILAVSARQRERKQRQSDYSQSLALYSTSIRLLSPVLGEKSTVVLASCMCLCVLEMLSCSPKAWRRHLDGCAALITAMEINGSSGGLEQALFWCFARMDMIGGWISAEKTLIPMDKWIGGIDLASDITLLKSSFDVDSYANLAVYLCGRVVELLCNSGRWDHHQSPSNQDYREYAAQWLRLWTAVDDWSDHRPQEMCSILVIPQSQDTSKPFPTVLYANPPAISGNQMYHTAALLMLKHKPAALHLDKKPRSMLWHAKRICAISISNAHHGCWTNSTNPLWLAGRFMSHPCEHKAILDLYERIERESGWATKWRADDLRAYWGTGDD